MSVLPGRKYHRDLTSNSSITQLNSLSILERSLRCIPNIETVYMVKQALCLQI